jgi:hypothetical protein
MIWRRYELKSRNLKPRTNFSTWPFHGESAVFFVLVDKLGSVS